MAGRPKKVVDISTGKIGKDEKEKRKMQEEKLKLSREQLKAPSFLNALGKKEFKRIVEEAGRINLLDNLDLGILSVYCNAYSSYVETTEKIEEEGYTIIKETRYDSSPVVNPLVTVQEKYVKQIMQCSAKLGLATTDRLKLIVPIEEKDETNKYLKFLEK